MRKLGKSKKTVIQCPSRQDFIKTEEKKLNQEVPGAVFGSLTHFRKQEAEKKAIAQITQNVNEGS